MRRVQWVLPVLCLAGSASSGYAQGRTVDPGDDLAVAVVVPPTMPGVDAAVRTQLESRLSQFLTGTGFAAVPGGSTLVMYPSLVVLEERTVGELQKRTMIKLDLSLYLKNASDGVLFASTNLNIAGVGPERNAAIINAVSSLRGGDPAVRQFASSARGRINEYYARNCDQVIADGRTQAGTGDIGRAMAVLMSVPRESAACHEKSSATAVRVYAELQQRECQSRLTKAKAEAAANHFVDAIDALEGIDPSAPCAREVDDLLGEITREVDRREQRELKIRLQTIRTERTTITRGLDSPAKITSRRVTLAAEARVQWLNREPRPTYGPELFKK
jgi:hypothetical protein